MDKKIDLLWGVDDRNSVWDVKNFPVESNNTNRKVGGKVNLSRIALFISYETGIPVHEVLLNIRLFWEYIAYIVSEEGECMLLGVGRFKQTPEHVVFRSSRRIRSKKKVIGLNRKSRYKIPRDYPMEFNEYEAHELAYAIRNYGYYEARNKMRLIMREKLDCYQDSYKDILRDHFETEEFAEWCKINEISKEEESERILKVVDTIQLSLKYAKKDFERILHDYRYRRYDSYLQAQQGTKGLCTE